MRNGFRDMVLPIENDHPRAMSIGFFGRRLHKAHDDDAIADSRETGRGAIDPDDSAAALSGYNVGFKAVAILAIGYDHGLVG